MKKTMYSIRIGMHYWEDEEMFRSLLAVLEKNRDCLDQVALFTTRFHAPMPLDTAAHNCALAKDRMRRIRALGLPCGVNILATLGHHPERLDEAVQGDWPHAENIDGEPCLGSYCPNDPAYREEYIAPLYRLHCAAEPDFIWIDDDIRSAHLPVGFCCFCDGCIDRFCRDYGHHFTREALRAALDDPQNVPLRKQWLCHQTDKYTSLLRFIRKTVNACGDIRLGLMSGERYFEGYDFAAWADALSDGGKHEIMWRPGGGAYNDRRLDEAIQKSSEIGRQVARLPAYVTDIQSEIEDFPGRLLDKSPRSMAMETLLYLSVGCTGAALNILPGTDSGEPPAVADGHLQAIRQVRPFAETLSAVLGRAPAAGICCGWDKMSQAAVPGSFTKGYGGDLFALWQEMYSIGLPECFDPAHAVGHLLTGRTPLALERETLLQILSQGVYMDAEAAAVLHDMGLGDLVGFSVGQSFAQDAVEVYTDHPINAGFVGGRRLCPQVFCCDSSVSLIPAEGAEILCRLEDYRGRTLTPCTMGLFHNRLGGTACVAGHFPHSELRDTQKCVQLKRLFRRLTGDRLPLLVESCCRIRAVARPSERRYAATLFNTVSDTLSDVAVLVPQSVRTLTCLAQSGKISVLSPVASDGAMLRYVIPELAGLSLCLLTDHLPDDFV